VQSDRERAALPVSLPKSITFGQENCGLTASHALSASGGQRARLQAEKYFSSPHMSPEKMIGLSFAASAAQGYEVF